MCPDGGGDVCDTYGGDAALAWLVLLRLRRCVRRWLRRLLRMLCPVQPLRRLLQRPLPLLVLAVMAVAVCARAHTLAPPPLR